MKGWPKEGKEEEGDDVAGRGMRQKRPSDLHLMAAELSLEYDSYFPFFGGPP